MDKTKSKTPAKSSATNPVFDKAVTDAEALTVEGLMAKATKKGKKLDEAKAKELVTGALWKAKKEKELNDKYGFGSGFKTKDGENGESNIVQGSLRHLKYKNADTGAESKKLVVDIDCKVNPGDIRTVATSDLHQVRGLGPKARDAAAKERNKGRKSTRKSASANLDAANEVDDILS